LTGDACLSPVQVAQQITLGRFSTIIAGLGFHDPGFWWDLERNLFYFEKRFKRTLKDLLNASFLEASVLFQFL
jgi:hypothetical protein